jgi:tetratricopeptide (TPR) repeat protein
VAVLDHYRVGCILFGFRICAVALEEMVKSPPSLLHQIFFTCIIVCIVALTFLPALSGEFVNWDDMSHVTENAAVKSFDLGEMFGRTVQKVYIPLTTFSFALEHKFFGFNPFVYHLDNVLLHIFNSLVVYVLAQRLGLSVRAALGAALLFGVHPMRVESVAWVTERKDLLYAFFYLLSLLQYMNYVKEKMPLPYAAFFLFGILSVLAKPMALSLPLVLFLIDWFSKRKFSWQTMAEKIPLVVVFVPIVWVTYCLHVRNPIENPMVSFLMWAWSFSFYFWKFIFPSVLVPVYHAPEPVSLGNPVYIFSLLLVAGICWSICGIVKNRWWIFAVLFYFLSIFFLLRFDSAKDINIVADRFMYLPSLGFCLIAGLGADRLIDWCEARAYHWKIAAQVFLYAVIVVLSLKSVAQTAIWNNSLVLWDYVIRHNPTEFLAYNDRAVEYINRKQYDPALADYGAILKFDPKNADAFFNRGILLAQMGRHRSAVEDFTKVAELYPHYEKAYYRRAKSFAALGEDELAFADYNRTIAANPSFPDGYLERGNIYNHRGEFNRALKDYDKVIELEPKNALAFNNRGTIHAKLLLDEQALDDFNRAADLDRNYAEAYYNRSIIRTRQGRFKEALEDGEKSRNLGAEMPEGYIEGLKNSAL